ncbi:hypothetical protein [Burkholderia vietnamiensis]|uniref:hypothetical protein n=1 Tax=Burkholderia vietnamiensis TaxID=60552 RepID=UPI0020197A4C|nr:hypothetical protein [Burkholderia vietnamiensis]MCO1350611.1 hypothetical protein [Burkholderia vietnamiensis]UQN46783.1 hypothetical protein L0Y95_00425 [Burkholderia vietnamiensis]
MIRHVVDYYYEVNGFSMPSLQDRVAVDALRQLKSAKECQSVERSPHFACDGVSMLNDACSLLDGGRLGERVYLVVILPSATRILQQPQKFGASYE